MRFSTKLYLPAIDKTVSVSEIEYGDYINLQKYLINNDDEETERYFAYLINKYVDYKGYLPALDRFIILLFQRVCSLHPDFEIVHNSITYKANLNDFINLLLEFEKRAKFPLQRVSTEMVDYYINLPSKFTYKLRADFIYDWIYCISSRDEKAIIDRTSINANILRTTPASISKQIEMIVDIITDAFSNIPIPIPEVLKVESSVDLKLDLADGVLLEVLKLFLRSNLLEWYQKNHFLITKGNHSLSDLYKLSPAEVNTYFKMIEEEAEKISEAGNTKNQQ